MREGFRSRLRLWEDCGVRLASYKDEGRRWWGWGWIYEIGVTRVLSGEDRCRVQGIGFRTISQQEREKGEGKKKKRKETQFQCCAEREKERGFH